MSNYIPDADAEFNNWQNNFTLYVQENQSVLGVTAEQMAQLVAYSVDWVTKYQAHLIAQDAARAATDAKNDSRSPFESFIRNIAGIMQANPDVSNAQRETAGLPVRKTSRTPVPAPSTRPVGNVEATQRWQHEVHYRDEALPTKAKPAGVTGCEIWCYVGTEAPAGPSAARFLGVDTRTPYLAEFAEEDGGKAAYYYLRWVNTRGEKGPWSETVVATILG